MTNANERLSQRVLNVDTLDIVKEITTANYTKVGEFKMTNILKSQISVKSCLNPFVSVLIL